MISASKGQRKEDLLESWRIIKFMQDQERKHSESIGDSLPRKISPEEARKLGVIRRVKF